MTGARGECPNDETLAAFVEGTLASSERRAVERHLATCNACLVAVGDAAASRRRATSRRWIYAATIAALLAVAAAGIRYVTTERDPVRQLTQIASTTGARPFVSRLHGFPHAPHAAARAADGLFDVRLMKLRAKAAEVVEARSGTGSAHDFHVRGVATLLAGDPATALADLQRAAELAPDDTAIWSDLAAAHYAVARHNQTIDALALVRSIAAADHALQLDPRNSTAGFNRALAITALGLDGPARSAWDHYLTIESDTAWAEEARTRRQDLEGPPSRPSQNALRDINDAVARGDRDAVHKVVAAYPQEIRTQAEVLVLNAWATALLDSNDAEAAARLEVARAIGDALVAMNGETLLRDTVAGIAATPRAEQRAIAEGQRDYYEARLLHRKGQTVEAQPLFERAQRAFRARKIPMAGVAGYYTAMALHAAGENDRALALLSRLMEDHPKHAALTGQLHWQRGAVLSATGMLVDALDAYRRALSVFEKLRERNNTLEMQTRIAGIEAALGHSANAWRSRLQVFRMLNEAGDAPALQTAVEVAARTEGLAGRWENAHALLTLAADPDLRRNHWLYVNTLVWRALAAHRLGWPNLAARDLKAAYAAASEHDAAAVRDEALNNIRFAEAIVRRPQEPAAAATLLTQYVDTATRAQNIFLAPEALLERARAYRMLKRDDAAIRDLGEALARLEKRRQRGHRFEDAYFETGDSCTRELIDLLDRRGRPGDVVEAVERGRARVIAERLQQHGAAPPLAAAEIHERLRENVVIAHLVALEDRVVIVTTARAGVRADRSRIPRKALAAESDAFVRAILEKRDDDADAISARLHSALIAPFADRLTPQSTLVLVTDPLLAALPFSAMRSATTRRFLIEDVALVVAPSATVYATLTSSGAKDLPGLPLIVGNPEFDRERFPRLQDLPSAATEAAALGRVYAEAIVLRGAEATKARLIQYLPRAGLVNIATHAVAIEADPAQSFLLLAPARGDGGLLSMSEIAETKLAGAPTVVLTGCRTSRQVERTEITSFASAFITAGAHNVLGTLWDVPDDESYRFSRAFHDALRSGVPPAEALRQIQINMARTPSGKYRIRDWSAFQLTGSGL